MSTCPTCPRVHVSSRATWLHVSTRPRVRFSPEAQFKHPSEPCVLPDVVCHFCGQVLITTMNSKFMIRCIHSDHEGRPPLWPRTPPRPKLRRIWPDHVSPGPWVCLTWTMSAMPSQACMLDMWRDRSLTCDGCGNAHDREQLEGTPRFILIIIIYCDEI